MTRMSLILSLLLLTESVLACPPAYYHRPARGYGSAVIVPGEGALYPKPAPQVTIIIQR